MTTHVFIHTPWPLWRRILFRFFFILFALQIAPVYWLNDPLTVYAADWYAATVDKVVNWANAHLFHVRETLVPLNGSGDTSFSWAQELTFLSLALLGCVLWSLVDNKRKTYNQLDYWMRTFLRYYIILVSFSYGFSKLFALQMPYPSQSLMATPLGDLLPMRLSWAFFGYATPYQVFGGLMEITVGVLLLFRRTTTAGLLLGTCVYFNVMMLNLSYDIPVKIFSMHYFFYCVYLLACQRRRLYAFFTNRFAEPYIPYRPHLSSRWMRVTKGAFIVIFTFFIIVVPFINTCSESGGQQATGPFRGIYDVTVFAIGNDTIPVTLHNTRRWNDIIFDNDNSGSINTTDTAFRQRYRRGYFNYQADTAKNQLILTRYNDDYEELPVCDIHYTITGDSTAVLSTSLHGNNIYMQLVKSNRKFQLAENQFHWLSEYNR